jgi:hypothetical protein
VRSDRGLDFDEWHPATGNYIEQQRGYLSGKATATGVYAFTIKVTDSQGTMIIKNMSLTVQ